MWPQVIAGVNCTWPAQTSGNLLLLDRRPNCIAPCAHTMHAHTQRRAQAPSHNRPTRRVQHTLAARPRSPSLTSCLRGLCYLLHTYPSPTASSTNKTDALRFAPTQSGLATTRLRRNGFRSGLATPWQAIPTPHLNVHTGLTLATDQTAAELSAITIAHTITGCKYLRLSTYCLERSNVFGALRTRAEGQGVVMSKAYGPVSSRMAQSRYGSAGELLAWRPIVRDTKALMGVFRGVTPGL